MLQVKLKGSSTIEASFVMPLVIGVLWVVIIFSYHIHNNVINQSVIDETNVIALANERCTEAISNEDCAMIYETISNNRPASSGVNGYGVNIGSSKIVSNVTYNKSLEKIPVISSLIKKKSFQTEQISTLSITHPEEILRTIYVSKLKDQS